LQIGFNSALKG